MSSKQVAETALDHIPLSKLDVSPANVRHIDAGGITELAESIKRDGLIQNLTVVPGAKGKYLVVAGGRRLRALKQLADEKAIKKDFDVPCRIVSEEEAAAISLAENQLRAPMHPLDQINAFKARIDAGDSIADTTSRFGVTETFVKQRLKLAAVSPKLLEEYRNGEMTLEQLQAFTAGDDHAVQEQVWAEVKDDYDGGDPDTIKYQMRRSGAIANNNVVLKFVTVAAYEKAGGKVIEDLFAEEGQGVSTLSDPELLTRLATEKLQKRADKMLKEEGLAFVEVMPGPWTIYTQRGLNMCEVQTIDKQPSPEVAAELEKLNTRLAEIDQRMEEIDDMDNPGECNDEYFALEGEREEVEGKINAIEDSLKEPHPDEVPHIGAVLSIDSLGKLHIHRNLIKPEHRAKAHAVSATTSSDPSEPGTSMTAAGGEDSAPKAAALSEKLVARLTAHKTAIMRDAMMPHVTTGEMALVTVVFHMLLEDMADYVYSSTRPLTMTTRHGYPQQHAADLEDSHAWARADKCENELLDPIRSMLAEVVGDSDQRMKAMWLYLAPMSMSHLLRLLAVCVANRVDLVKPTKNSGRPASEFLEPVFLTNDMIAKHYWQPTRANYLDHVSKAQIIADVTDACGPEAAGELVPMKRDAAAARAEELLAGTGWLPEPLRVGN